MLSVYQQDPEVKYTSSASLTIFFQETTCVKLTENEKVSGVSPAHLTVESTVRFISGFPTKNEQIIFFHWHRGWVIPPLQSTPPRLVLRGVHRLVKIPKVSWVTRWVTLGGFHQPSPTLGGREKKITQHLENWILFLLDFHWFFWLVIFFLRGGGGAGDRPLQHVTLWL